MYYGKCSAKIKETPLKFKLTIIKITTAQIILIYSKSINQKKPIYIDCMFSIIQMVQIRLRRMPQNLANFQ